MYEKRVAHKEQSLGFGQALRATRNLPHKSNEVKRILGASPSCVPGLSALNLWAAFNQSYGGPPDVFNADVDLLVNS